MRRLLVKIAVVSSGATAAVLTLVGGASAATAEPAKAQTTDQVVAELAAPDATPAATPAVARPRNARLLVFPSIRVSMPRTRPGMRGVPAIRRQPVRNRRSAAP